MSTQWWNKNTVCIVKPWSSKPQQQGQHIFYFCVTIICTSIHLVLICLVMCLFGWVSSGACTGLYWVLWWGGRGQSLPLLGHGALPCRGWVTLHLDKRCRLNLKFGCILCREKKKRKIHHHEPEQSFDYFSYDLCAFLCKSQRSLLTKQQLCIRVFLGVQASVGERYTVYVGTLCPLQQMIPKQLWKEGDEQQRNTGRHRDSRQIPYNSSSSWSPWRCLPSMHLTLWGPSHQRQQSQSHPLGPNPNLMLGSGVDWLIFFCPLIIKTWENNFYLKKTKQSHVLTA